MNKIDLYRHRPDIDGLRGMAVIAVLVFHANEAWLPGGFTGVDIFFVISGYVVTASILRYQSSGFVEYLAGFYKRRFLRLMPALLACVLVVTLVSALFVMPDTLTDALSVGKWALLGWSNNYLIAASNDYFGLSAALNPFTHTWSLGVETQFYIFFPILLAGVYGLRRPAKNKRWAVWMLLTLAVLSALLSQHLTETDLTRAYYFTPSRLWEIALGAVLFSALVAWPNWLASLSIRSWQLAIAQLCVVALLTVPLIFAAVSQGFPIPWAVPTVIGTLTFIVIGLDERSLLNRWATHSVLTYLGKISYSLYLWHWPIFVLFRWTIGLDSGLKIILALLLTIAVSLASYYLLERPVRKVKAMSPQQVFAITIAGILIVGAANVAIARPLQGSLYLYQDYNRADWRAKPNQILVEGSQISGSRCENEDGTAVTRSQIETCTVASSRPEEPHIFLVGDSHAEALVPMLDQLHKDMGVGITTVFNRGCLFSQTIVSNGGKADEARCHNYARDILEFIDAEAKPNDVVLAVSRYSFYLNDSFPIAKEEQENYQQKGLGQDYKEGLPINKAAARALLAKEYAQLAERLAAKNIRFVVQAPLPEHYARADECLPTWFSAGSGLKPTCFTTRAANLDYQQPMKEMLETMQQASPDIYVWESFDALCPDEVCLHFHANKPLVYDDDHLSIYGSRFLAPHFAKFLQRHRLG